MPDILTSLDLHESGRCGIAGGLKEENGTHLLPAPVQRLLRFRHAMCTLIFCSPAGEDAEAVLAGALWAPGQCKALPLASYLSLGA